MKPLVAGLIALCMATMPAAAEAEWPGRIEILPVQSRTLSGEEFLRGGAPGREVLLGGELRLPLNAPAKVPAVILVHGSGRILRLFHGISDDYVNIVPCRDYTGRLKAAGADVSLTEYPDSQHGFDSPTSPPLVAVPKAQSTRNCRLKEGPNGAILDAGTGQPYSLKTDPCVAIGAYVGHNAEATDAARAAVLRFVQQTLVN